MKPESPAMDAPLVDGVARNKAMQAYTAALRRDKSARESMTAAIAAYEAAKPESLEAARSAEAVATDVARLVIAARAFAYSDPFPEDKTELDQALEAFAERVRWDDEPDEDSNG